MIRRCPRNRRPSWASFTLVEMIVAIAIATILLLVLSEIDNTLVNTWQLSQARNERRSAGQTVLNRMTRDLRQAALPLGGANTSNLEFVINPPGVSANYTFPQAVFWEAPVATDGGTNGNMAIVGYCVQWIGNAPLLSRVLINPSSSANYGVYSNATNWISDSLIQIAAPSTSAANFQGVLANNVLGLWVQALDPNGNPIQQDGGLAGENFDSRLSYNSTNALYDTTAVTNLPPVMPAALQIAIVLVDSRTANRLTTADKPSTANLTGNFWTDISTFYNSLPKNIRSGAEIQTTTVDMIGGPR